MATCTNISLFVALFSFLILECHSQVSNETKTIMQVVALFGGGETEIGIDHRLGRQVLKLAASRAQQIHPNIAVELNFISDQSACDTHNKIPALLAARLYLPASCQVSGAEPSRCSTADHLDPDGDEPEVGDSTRLMDAIIGPSCSFLVDAVARMAAYWSTPIYTMTSVEVAFARKEVYPTLTRLSPSIEQVSEFVVRTMEWFGWRHLAVLVDKSQPLSRISLDSIERTMLRMRFTVPIEWRLFDLTDRSASNSTEHGSCWPEARHALLGARRVARVFLLLLDDMVSVRRLLVCAHELGLGDGESAFMALDLGLKAAGAEQVAARQRAEQMPWYSAQDVGNNMVAKRMFESLLLFSVELPISREFSLFVEQTLDLAHEQYPEVGFDRSSVGSVAVAMHDSLLLAVEAFARRGSTNATSLPAMEPDEMAKQQRKLSLLWNDSYSSGLITGLHINANGDQELDYVLNDLEPEMGVMRPVARYSKDLRQLEPSTDAYVQWPALADGSQRDSAPADEPECGFTGEADKCVDRQNLYAALCAGLAIASCFALMVLFSVFKYKKIRYQMQLNDNWWRIDWKELQFVQASDSLVSSRPQSLARLVLSGAGSLVSSEGRSGASSMISVSHQQRQRRPAKIQQQQQPDSQSQAGDQSTVLSVPVPRSPNKRRPAVFTILTTPSEERAQQEAETVSLHRESRALSVAGSGGPTNFKSELSSVVRAANLAMYRGELVIVKQLNGRAVDLSHDVLVDLKAMREHTHENLARFMGLCLDVGRVAIVYEFCSRGNLQELLLNPSIQMDWTLRYSIIGDLLSGLQFIHTTPLGHHGRLKSTNLVLDSRFTLKITDFGLRNFYSQFEAINELNDSDDEDHDDRDDYQDVERHAHQEEDTTSVAGHLKVRQPQRDTLSISVSQRALNIHPNRKSRGQHQGQSASGLTTGTRLRLKSRASARHFWTAPEHLRSNASELTGSRSGDIYALGVILYEILTRREPYYYGTNAKPNWQTIKRDQTELDQDRGLGTDSRLSTAGEQQQTSNQQTSRRISLTRKRRAARGSVAPDTAAADSSSCKSAQSVGSSRHSTSHPENWKPIALSPILADELEEADSMASSEHSAASALNNKQPSTVSRRKLSLEPLDGEEVLDQIRMGLQPDPVRPHLPHFVLREANPKLVDLIRACWSEAPSQRPNVGQLQQTMRKLTKGIASRNYLDNLLDRLQNYAADLERIVDMKSGDILEEKQRTEELLYQLVPKFVAERLKVNEPIAPQLFDCVTILFSDIVGFEKICSSSQTAPSDLVDLLNTIYSSFDSIISSFDVTKIETILDQFLIASGISLDGDQCRASPGSEQQTSSEPQPASGRGKLRSKLLGPLVGETVGLATGSVELLPNESLGEQHYKVSSAEQIARMAFCLRDFVKTFQFQFRSKSALNQQVTSFNIRIGVHSGRVCSGIVGLKRPKFCLIGDAVNVASRMHTNSKANKIQVSAATRELLAQVPGLSLEPRGKIEVKGKGKMETFWLESAN